MTLCYFHVAMAIVGHIKVTLTPTAILIALYFSFVLCISKISSIYDITKPLPLMLVKYIFYFEATGYKKETDKNKKDKVIFGCLWRAQPHH